MYNFLETPFFKLYFIILSQNFQLTDHDGDNLFLLNGRPTKKC